MTHAIQVTPTQYAAITKLPLAPALDALRAIVGDDRWPADLHVDDQIRIEVPDRDAAGYVQRHIPLLLTCL